MTITVLAVLGLCMGSFINALVWRLHRQENNKQKTTNKKQYSILKGRSICPNCKHQLTPADLIPVFSWLWLRGKCRYCKKPISAQYPLVELVTAALFIFSYVFWPYELSGIDAIVFGLWLVILVGLIALAVYDIRWMILPNRIIFPLFVLVIIAVLLQAAVESDISLVTSSLWGAVIGGGIFYVLFQISGGNWIGGGDVKLGFLLGTITGGIIPAFMMLFIASLLGSIFSIPVVLKNNLGTKAKIAFGPFLILSAVIVVLFEEQIIDLYNNLLML